MSGKQLYRTFVATSLKVEELLKFLLDFSELECTSWTITCITWSETSPRLCTVAVHVEQEQDYLLLASFKDGMLHLDGWDKRFLLMPETTTVEEMGSEFKEPKLPNEATLKGVRGRQSPTPIGLVATTSEIPTR